MADFYEVLGVPKDADEAAIKKAFRRRSKEAHPDRHGGDERKMVAITVAYRTLKNRERRKYYDATGGEAPISDEASDARTLLFEAVMAVLGAEQEAYDLVRATQYLLEGVIRQAENKKVAEAKKIRARIEKHRRRLKRKSGTNEITDLLFKDQILAIEEAMEKYQRRLTAISGAVRLLKDYTYDQDQAALGTAISAMLGGRR